MVDDWIVCPLIFSDYGLGGLSFVFSGTAALEMLLLVLAEMKHWRESFLRLNLILLSVRLK